MTQDRLEQIKSKPHGEMVDELIAEVARLKQREERLTSLLRDARTCLDPFEYPSMCAEIDAALSDPPAPAPDAGTCLKCSCNPHCGCECHQRGGDANCLDQTEPAGCQTSHSGPIHQTSNAAPGQSSEAGGAQQELCEENERLRSQLAAAQEELRVEREILEQAELLELVVRPWTSSAGQQWVVNLWTGTEGIERKGSRLRDVIRAAIDAARSQKGEQK